MPVRQWLRDAIVGAVLFVSCSYILVVNPAILRSAGIPGGHVLAATALVAAVGTFIMGAWARAPSVVAPGMGPGARVVAPVGRVMPRDARAVPGAKNWDRYGPTQAGADEEVYFFQLLAGSDGWTRTLLRNAAGDRGVSSRFSTAELPCFTLWKNSTSLEDGYLTGLEPGTNFPNHRSFEKSQNRVRSLAPGERVRFELAIEVHPDAAAVAEAEAAVAALQLSAKPQVCLEPRPGWTEPS